MKMTKEPIGIEALLHIDRLPVLRKSRAFLASSYDRRGGNYDWGNYLYLSVNHLAVNYAVILNENGPGCITRIWSANPVGTLKIYLDGKLEVDMDFKEFLGKMPLRYGVGWIKGNTLEMADIKRRKEPGGWTCYLPILFQRSCRVVQEPPLSTYYQINYCLFPKDAEVKTFQMTDIGQSIDITKNINSMWDERGRKDPKPHLPNEDLLEKTFSFKSGQKKNLFQLNGPGTIQEIRVYLPEIEKLRERNHILRSLIFKIHFDEDRECWPSVYSPLGPFFMDFGQGIDNLHSLLAGFWKDSYYCYFPMPFRNRATLSLENRGLLSIKDIKFKVRYACQNNIADNLGYFKAFYHHESPFGHNHLDYWGIVMNIPNLDGVDNYKILQTRGHGHFVGCAFKVDLSDCPTSRSGGEADEMFFIDNNPKLTHYGTGNEDFVNDAWGFHPADKALSGGSPIKTRGFWGYRLFIADCIPYQKEARFTLEHGTSNNCSGEYESTAYWYAEVLPPEEDTRMIPGMRAWEKRFRKMNAKDRLYLKEQLRIFIEGR